MARTRLERKIAFSSGHRYWFADLSEAENRNLFGEWASPYNHGHNYVLTVIAEGPVASDTGMVVNIKDIDALVRERVIRQFDQKSINDEIPAFARTAPCVENLLTYFDQQLQELPPPAELAALKLEETPLLYGEWDRHTNMTTITRIYEFAAAHRLYSDAFDEAKNWDLYNKCAHPNFHGHNYVLEVTVSGTPDPQTGMIVDLGQLDHAVKTEVVDRYDHRNLNLDIPEYEGKVTTSEVVAETIFEKLARTVPGQLERVRLHETARNIFEVTRS
jgi:6-pyruvoyltetrahydropterin/6-carboxytetrahydropterin synthase